MPDIRLLIAQQKAFYNSIGSVYCPILKEMVHFTSSGYYHLLYESSSRPGKPVPRKVSEQYLKLICLEDAPFVIQNCTHISQTRIIIRKLKGNNHEFTYYGLVHKGTSGRIIKVIVERVGKGKYKFLSVMPNTRRHKIKKRPGGRS